MRGFIVLCLVAVAVAAPQYNYQQPAANTGFLAQAQPSQNNLQQSFAPAGAQSVQQGFGQVSGGGGSVGGGSVGGSFGQGTIATFPQQYQAPTIYNKQFFIHAAPEDDTLDGAGSSQGSAALRKNLRIVIVKAPENRGLTNAALQLAKSASEDKTVVYVLNKQTDLSELQNQLSQIQSSNPNKPEVHFVKYRTPEEAEHAQHSIQSQYDSFGGPTQVLNEGVAPSESFVGSLGSSGSLAAGSNQGGIIAGSGGNFGTVTNTYLPARQF